MRTGFLIKAICTGVVVSITLVSGCTSKKATSPTEPDFYLMKNYFPLNEHDWWRWEVGGFSIQEYYIDGDVNLGEPFVDVNANGVYDLGEEFEDLNFNGKYDGPNDPWTPGIPYMDRNSNGEYDAPNGVWDEGEFFLDLDSNGVGNLATILTLYAKILYPRDDIMVRGGLYRGTFSNGEPGGIGGDVDYFSNDSLGIRWHKHVDPKDWNDLLAELKPITIANASIQVGDSVVNVDTSYVQGHPSCIYTWISVFEGVEDVTVPAGTFEDCLKLKSEASGWTGNMERYNGTSYQWYAKNVGLVKLEGPTEDEYWILKSASVGGTDYP
ncbi:hypothetical protein AMJ44_11120 [candidate division WOR-1 bacterium DG_54_3]|uniref:DUF3108 domain-containing protein n=1 Tax=candidate division WOR-1 bacterium DG_54_3 TaxID=1703775 RepID=A0A0S7XRN0_UNCSA|nr:MAG: hypothetical protein AMJ44_11120 [candidate division WOR-1 bacterium DG_54_3]